MLVSSTPVPITINAKPSHDHDDVRLLTETLVAELVAARLWLAH